MSDEDLDNRLTRALERAPEVVIPEGFALRVAARAPARGAAELSEIHPSHVGTRVAAAAAVMLLVAMFLLAPLGGAKGWLEVGFAIEFAGLTAWLGMRQSIEL